MGRGGSMQLFDLHCDSIVNFRKEHSDFLCQKTQFFLRELAAFDRLCQTMAIFIPDDVRNEAAVAYFRNHKEYLDDLLEKQKDLAELVRGPEDMERITANGKCAVILAVESGAALAGSLENVDYLAENGVKMMTLVWNGPNELGSGQRTDQGLTPFGRQAVKRMEQAGIIADVSHLNDRGFQELCEIAEKPFIATHSNLRSVCAHKRNLTEEQFQEIVDRKGLVGVMLEMLWRVTNEYKSGFTVHISETEFDREATKALHGLYDAPLLEELGIVGPNVLMVHCCYLTDADMDMAQKYDIKVSHNVCSNMYLSSGVAPVPEMLKRGINVSLGVDGTASNNAQDMVELMKFTALQHKVATKDPLAISAEKVLELATIDGARAVGLENEVGSLEIGKKADLVIFDPLECPKAIPMHNPVSTLVYSSSLKNITGVMVDGQVIMKDGIIVRVKDEKEVYRSVQRCAEDLCVRGQITNRREGHKWNSVY